MSAKKLSIITVNFNNRDGLLKTISSVINQTYRDFEFIIIDGGSTDGSVDVIKTYADKIDYWVSEHDTGVYHAMNKGVAAAQGEYCNFMNSGDCFYNNTVLEKVFVQKNMADILIGKARTPHRIIDPPGNPTLAYFYNREPINHQAAFIRRHLLLKYPYDEKNLKIVSDWKFFLDAFIAGNCSYQPIREFIVDFDAGGVGSLNMDINLAEQSNVINAAIYPRILEDYQIIKYKNSAVIRASLPIARFFERYGKFFSPGKYFRKLKKLARQ